jgi:hypothetical protein
MKLKSIGLYSLLSIFAVTFHIPTNAEGQHPWEIERIDDRLNDTYRCIARLRKDGPRPQLYADGSIWFGGMGTILAYQLRYNESPAHGLKTTEDKWVTLKASKWQNDQRIRMTVLPRYRSGSYFFDVNIASALEALRAVKECKYPYKIESTSKRCGESLPNHWTEELCSKYPSVCEAARCRQGSS